MEINPSGLYGYHLFGNPFTPWCAGCSAEPAVTTMEAEFNGQWVPVQLGENCLTKFGLAGKIEE